MADNPPKLGEILFTDVPRDAIHIAIAPVIAAGPLMPGDHIGFVGDGNKVSTVSQGCNGAIGIVDPYIRYQLMEGDCFYMFLYPNTITGLHHQWTHPEFDKPREANGQANKKKAQEKIQFWADQAGISFEKIMEGARDYLNNDRYLSQGDRWEGFSIDGGDFWSAYEAYTGTKIPKDQQDSFFTCSC